MEHEDISEQLAEATDGPDYISGAHIGHAQCGPTPHSLPST